MEFQVHETRPDPSFGEGKWLEMWDQLVTASAGGGAISIEAPSKLQSRTEAFELFHALLRRARRNDKGKVRTRWMQGRRYYWLEPNGAA